MSRKKDINRHFSASRILIAVALGLGASIWLMLRDFDMDLYRNLDFKTSALLFLLLAFLMMVIRDLAYMYRFRILTGKEVSWRKSFQVIMLWEFGSALTPTIVGGSAVALFIVNKELKNTGKATAIVMITALLDEFFYIVMVPLMILLVGAEQLFIQDSFSVFGIGNLPAKNIFIVGYVFILSLTTIISFAIFFKPIGFKRVLGLIFKLPFLKKWRENALQTGDEIIMTSKEVKNKKIGFWLKVISATFASWTARFLVVNFLIIIVMSNVDHFMIFARQLVMWVILLISPTPGGSVVAEIILPEFLEEFIGGFGNELALSWRLISYYAYLIIGAIVLPTWINRVYKYPKKKSSNS